MQNNLDKSNKKGDLVQIASQFYLVKSLALDVTNRIVSAMRMATTVAEEKHQRPNDQEPAQELEGHPPRPTIVMIFIPATAPAIIEMWRTGNFWRFRQCNTLTWPH